MLTKNNSSHGRLARRSCLDEDVTDLASQHREVFQVGQRTLNVELVQLAVDLGPQSPNGRAFRVVQHLSRYT